MLKQAIIKKVKENLFLKYMYFISKNITESETSAKKVQNMQHTKS